MLSVVRTERSGAFIQNRVHKKHMITNTCYTGQQHDMIKEARVAQDVKRSWREGCRGTRSTSPRVASFIRGFRDSNNAIAIDRSIPPIGGSKHEELTTMIWHDRAGLRGYTCISTHTRTQQSSISSRTMAHLRVWLGRYGCPSRLVLVLAQILCLQRPLRLAPSEAELVSLASSHHLDLCPLAQGVHHLDRAFFPIREGGGGWGGERA